MKQTLTLLAFSVLSITALTGARAQAGEPCPIVTNGMGSTGYAVVPGCDEAAAKRQLAAQEQAQILLNQTLRDRVANGARVYKLAASGSNYQVISSLKDREPPQRGDRAVSRELGSSLIAQIKYGTLKPARQSLYKITDVVAFANPDGTKTYLVVTDLPFGADAPMHYRAAFLGVWSGETFKTSNWFMADIEELQQIISK